LNHWSGERASGAVAVVVEVPGGCRNFSRGAGAPRMVQAGLERRARVVKFVVVGAKSDR